MKKIAINGFGRIGRLLFRYLVTYHAKDINIVAINDLGDGENLAYLLKYDTVYGRFPAEVAWENGWLRVGDQKVKVLQEKDLAKLPWGELGIDLAVEATGAFESFEAAKGHLAAGAKRAVITAPAKDEEGEGRTVLVGVNDKGFSETKLTSNGSCTTNSASPVIEILRGNPGILKAVLNTVHANTALQGLVDGTAKGKDFRRGRAAGQNIVPSTTGAALAVTRAIPELEGKFDGVSLRVPVLAGSIADITFVAARPTTAEEINGILEKAAGEKRWQGILKTTNEQLVSSDIIGEPFAAIVDLSLTKVVDGDLVKVFSWYDNEWGYAAILAKHIQQALNS